MKYLKTIFQIFILTILYVLFVPIITMGLMSLGFAFPENQTSQSIAVLQLFAAGFIYAVFSLFLAKKYQMNKQYFLLVLFCLFFLSNLSVAIEGYMFTPNFITAQVFFSIAIQQFLVSAFLSTLFMLILCKRTTINLLPNNRNTSKKEVWVKLVFSSLVYMVLYYIWGWLNYHLFTKPFYDAGIAGLNVPLTQTLLTYIFLRGILIAISILPFIWFALPNNKFKMYEAGAILFFFGGFIPSLFMLGVFPIKFILLSLIEIFLQNFMAGILIYKIFSSNKSISRFKSVHN